jgi:hypothetical protein
LLHVASATAIGTQLQSTNENGVNRLLLEQNDMNVFHQHLIFWRRNQLVLTLGIAQNCVMLELKCALASKPARKIQRRHQSICVVDALVLMQLKMGEKSS